MNYFTAVKQAERKTKMSATQVAAAQVASNTPTLEAYRVRAKELGEEKGKAPDSQIKFALMMIEGAYHGRFDLQPNKHGPGMDDAGLIASDYGQGFSSTSLFNTKGKSFNKDRSNGRKCIRAGTSPQWGSGQPLANVNDLVDGWRTLRKQGTKGLDDCFNALMRYLTVQQKESRLITGEALLKFCYKPVKEEATGVEIITAASKLLHKLTVGKAPGCKEIDTSPEVKAAITSLNKRLTAIAKGSASSQAAA